MKRVLIANRGEIAVRAVRACRRLGLESVAVYSTADCSSRHVFKADRAVCIGPAAASASYLDMDHLLETVRGTGCDAVYPGYGFLSESPEFVRRCEAAGVTFIGPSAALIASMGDKATARRTVASLGVPVVPGSEGGFTDVAVAEQEVASIGFPVLVKASAGGGGRGMRVVRNIEEFSSAFQQARAEAESAFGNGELYMERFFDRVKHIEVQVFGDEHGNTCHLWERDCSVQRRHQKLIEEAPSPALDDPTREAITSAAQRITEGIGYVGAGTVEFILDMETNEFFFIEMNTRIQVEHPVTEVLTGADLVAEQLRVAAGKKLQLRSKKRVPDRHCIEWRICAEDPARGFMPSPGRITRYRSPEGPGVRIDTHIYEGYEISPFYDSMIAKLIIMGADRAQVLERSEAALCAMEIEGVVTNIAFHLEMIRSDAFHKGEVHTRWVEQQLDL